MGEKTGHVTDRVNVEDSSDAIIDPATEGTLSSVLSILQTIDTNTDELEAKLDSVDTSLGDVDLNTDEVEAKLDTLSTQTDELETLLTSLDGKDFATETTLDTLLTEANFDTKLGEVQSTPTTDTVLGRLKDITDNVQSVINNTDSLEANTDGLESKLDTLETSLTSIEGKLDTLNSTDFATETTLDDLNTAVGDSTDASTTAGGAGSVHAKIRKMTSQLNDIDNVLDSIDADLTTIDADLGDNVRQEDGHGSQKSDPSWTRESVNRRRVSGLSFSQSLTGSGSHTTSWVDVQDVNWLDLAFSLTSGATLDFTIEFTDAADPNNTAPGSDDIVRDQLTELDASSTQDPALGFPAEMQWARVTVTDTTGSSQDVDVATFAVGVHPPGSQISLDQAITGEERTQLTRAISLGQQPDGDFESVPTDGEAFRNSTALGADEVFTSEWTDTDGWGTIEVFIVTDEVSAEDGIEIQFTGDVQASTPTVRGSLQYTYSESDAAEGFTSIFIPTHLDGYRVKYTNGSTAQSSFFIASTLRVNQVQEQTTHLTTNLDESNLATLTRSVQVGQQPDGDFVNNRSSGEAFRTTTLLAAGETFTSDWYDTDGWGSIQIIAAPDQPSAEEGMEVQFTRDAQASPVPVDFERTFTVDQNLVNEGGSEITIPTVMDGFRIKYTNGGTGQNEFLLVATLNVTRQNPQDNIVAPVTNKTPATIVRGNIIARDSNSDWSDIQRSDGQGGLETAVIEHETDTPIRGLSNWEAGQVTVTSDSAVQVAGGGISDRKTIVFKNNGTNAADVFIGKDSAVTESTGFPVSQFESVEIEIEADTSLWAILSSDAGGSTNTQTLGADATLTNNGVVNPGNVFASDDTDGTWDDQDDNAEFSVDDFSFSTDHDTISQVEVGFEGARVDDSQKQTINIEETVSDIQAGGTSVTTTGSLTAVEENYYVAFIPIRDDTHNVDSVAGLGLSWSLVTTVTNLGDVEVEVWEATGGSPDSSGQVTANFDSEVESAGIAAQRISGVDLSSPRDSTATNTGATTGWSVTPGSSNSGDRILGGAAIVRSTTNDPGGDDAEHVEESFDGAAGEDLTFAVQSHEATSSGESTDGTWGTADGWAAAAIALNQADASDPTLTLTYEVGSEGDGPTSLTATLDSTSDQTFKQDVTEDRSWTSSDLDNTKLTLNLDNISLDAAIDHIFVEVLEAESTASQRCAFLEVGGD